MVIHPTVVKTFYYKLKMSTCWWCQKKSHGITTVVFFPLRMSLSKLVPVHLDLRYFDLTSVIRLDPLGTMNILRFHDNKSNCC